MSRRNRAKEKTARRGSVAARRFGVIAVLLAFVAGLWASSWLLDLDRIVRSRFEGRRFAVPSRVYAAPIVIYPGADWQRLDLAGWLTRMGYREDNDSARLGVGHYRWLPGRLRVHLRAFAHPQLPESHRKVEFRFNEGRVTKMTDARGQSVDVVALEPEPISAYYGSDREQRDLVRIADVPPHLISAIYAVEDRRFEAHHGVDPRRIVGAMLANLRAGGIRQGGSTLTQQLVKNFFLTPERTLRRKFTEAVMALIVEARYEKPQILEAYLNEIYMGHRGSTAIHGVGEASRFFFGKGVADLAVEESAVLAAVIQSPNALSPHRHPKRARRRRDLVLSLMRDQGYIDREIYERTSKRSLSMAAVTLESGQDRYFLDELARQLPEVYDENLLANEGLRIYSTLDPILQRSAVRHLQEGLARLEKELGEVKNAQGEKKPLQGCLLAMRPQTGEILAMVGGRDYATSRWNRCTLAKRQVGSVFKPVVYAAALSPQSGPAVTLASRVDDSPLDIATPQGTWSPKNYDKTFRGPVSVREALERSLNVPAARIGQIVGIPKVIEMARRLGVKSALPNVPSLALGTAELSPLEVATVYATFANAGLRPTPRSFIGLLDEKGVGQEQWPLAGSRRVLDPGTAYLTTSLLEGVVDRGTGVGIRSRGLLGPIAGKTGTTDDENDLWFVGFTPELVAVVWVGYDEPRRIGVPSSRGALPIWANFLSAVTNDRVRGFFAQPSAVERVDIDPVSGARALIGCPGRSREFFLAGTAPESTCPRFEPRGRRRGDGRAPRRRGPTFLDRLFGG